MYVLQVKTGSEIETATTLKLLGYDSRLPIEERLERRGRVWQTSERILFTSYVFVNFAYTDNDYYRICGLPSVIKFLGKEGNNAPTEIEDNEAALITALAPYSGYHIRPAKGKIENDGNVLIFDNNLALLQKKILKIDRHAKKVTVEVMLCGKPYRLKLSVDFEK